MEVDWIAADWGTTNLRVWAIKPDGSSLLVAESGLGMSRLKPSEYASVLDNICAGLARSDGEAIDVVICGMAGARQGWLEAPYIEAPASLLSLGAHAVRPPHANPRLRPRILPGICIRSSGIEDVMRGEETQLLGLTALMPGFSGTVILPGTHSKWASLENGTLMHFATAMTGELFHAIGSHTVLAQSVSVAADDGAMSPEGVSSGLADGLEAPQRLTSMMFKVRAASLLSARGAEWCRGYLSGLLIGAEVGGNADWLAGQAVVPLLGSAKLSPIYLEALKHLGKDGKPVDAALATIEGLKTSYSREPA